MVEISSTSVLTYRKVTSFHFYLSGSVSWPCSFLAMDFATPHREITTCPRTKLFSKYIFQDHRSRAMTSQKTEDLYKVQLTGNPFVDTDLAVIAHLSDWQQYRRSDPCTYELLHGDGESLARNNIELKSSYQLFGSDCLILQNRIEREQRIMHHTKVTLAVLNSIGHEDIVERCDTCGNDRSLDLDKLVRASGYDAERKERRKKKGKAKAEREEQKMKNESTTTKYHAGRDWFPLAGSMGSDAQALPCASVP